MKRRRRVVVKRKGSVRGGCKKKKEICDSDRVWGVPSDTFSGIMLSYTGRDVPKECLKRSPGLPWTSRRTVAWRGILSALRGARPAPCEWLSKEEYVLPRVVNIVYTMTFKREGDEDSELDMVRIAQALPNTKYRPRRFAAITIRLHPTTALLFTRLNMVLVKTTCENMARHFCQLYRQLLEKVPIMVRNRETGEVGVGTFEGRLGFSKGKVENMVGNAVLPQDGVHLGKLLYSDEEANTWVPDSFPNLIYKNKLPDGTPFCANISNTGKVVLMGLKDQDHLYEAYKHVCDVVHNYEDPTFPMDPRKRLAHRTKQLLATNEAFRVATDKEDADDLLNMGDEYDEDADGERDPLMGMLVDVLSNFTTNDDTMKDVDPAFVAAAMDTGEDDNDDDNSSSSSSSDEDSGDVGADINIGFTPPPVVRVEHTLLMQTADAGLIENVEYVLSQGPDAWERDKNGRTALERIEESMDPAHKSIAHLLRAYMDAHPQSE